MLLQGAGLLFPYNALVTAVDYFDDLVLSDVCVLIVLSAACSSLHDPSSNLDKHVTDLLAVVLAFILVLVHIVFNFTRPLTCHFAWSFCVTGLYLFGVLLVSICEPWILHSRDQQLPCCCDTSAHDQIRQTIFFHSSYCDWIHNGICALGDPTSHSRKNGLQHELRPHDCHYFFAR